jgi:CHAT domain-containing protein/tetratricopeptide (TPR) repeat protein
MHLRQRCCRNNLEEAACEHAGGLFRVVRHLRMPRSSHFRTTLTVWMAALALLLFVALAQPVASAPLLQESEPTPSTSVLFEDDFSDPNSGWDVDEPQQGEAMAAGVGYKDGAYAIVTPGRGLSQLGGSNQYLSDVVVDVDATMISAPDGSWTYYGVGCRTGGLGGYYLLIHGNGSYGIVKINRGEFDWLVEWQDSAAVRQGNEMNHLRAICAGPYLALYANGELLVETWDDFFQHGEVVLVATSSGDEPAEFHFDNFVALAPDMEALPSGAGAGESEGASATPPVTTTVTPAPSWVLDEQAEQKLLDAMIMHAQGNYERELELLEDALDLYRQSGNRHNEATALQLLGGAYQGLSDYDRALEHFQEALAISRELENRWGEARMLHGIGNVYSALSDHDEALAQYELSLAIDREIDEQEGEAITLGSIGAIYLNLGDFEQALAFFQQSQAIEDPSGIMGRQAEMLGSIGTVYMALGDHEQALAHFEEALTLFRAWGDRSGEVNTLGNIGLAHQSRGEADQALAYYEKVLALVHEMGDRRGEAATLNNLGTLYLDILDWERALGHLEEALQISREIGDRSGEADALNNIGNVHRVEQEYEKALEAYEQALTIMQEIGDRVGEAITLRNIGEIHELLESKPEALEFYLQSIAVREDVRTGMQVEAFQAALAAQDVDVYQRAVRLMVELERPQDAFSLSERNRARVFLDAMGNSRPDLRQGADMELLHQEELLRGELAALEGNLLAEKAKAPHLQNEQIARTVEEQLAVKQGEYEDLLARIQLSNPELASLVTIPATTVADSQALLDEQTALVAYYLTDGNALAFVLTRDDFQVVELPASTEEIGRAVEGFRSLGLANLGNAHPRSLSDLYEWLVVPLEPYLTTPKVGIIPHQALHYVPFAALSDGDQFLGERFALFYLPSAGTLPFIQAKEGREKTAPLILGDPETGNADLPRLAHAAEEAALVAEIFGSDPLLGAEASEGVVRARVGGAGVVHLAAHGAFNAVAPLFSRLWLAPGGEEDGRLNVHEVYGLDLDRADLVVLSACQTQVGELSAGDEVVGLTRAFLYGAPTVVSSLWSVDDAATGELMARFYEHLLTGKGKAEALQAAQAEVRADPAHPEWAHPYYWAAFVLSGDAGRVSAPSPTATAPPPATLAPTVAATSSPVIADDGTANWLLPGAGLTVVLIVAVLVAILLIRKRRRS